MKQKYFILVAVLIAVIFTCHKALSKRVSKCKESSIIIKSVSLPEIQDKEIPDEIIRHNYYVLSYNEEHEQPNWVQYIATKEGVNGTVERDGTFTEDACVSTASAKSADYKKSKYDRGHLCPAADMRYNTTSMKESFYMSNISPQMHQFNAGIWLDLENHVRDLVGKHDSLYVISGPVLNKRLSKINGKYNKISIPEYFYKIIYSKSDNWIECYLVPQSTTYKNKLRIDYYRVTVDSVENLTHIDFLKGIYNEKYLESNL